MPDALTALCRLIATLHDCRGQRGGQGPAHRPAARRAHATTPACARSVGLRPGFSSWAGARCPADVGGPAVAILGIDAPPSPGAAHNRAGRPGQPSASGWPRATMPAGLPGPGGASACHAPWDAEVSVTRAARASRTRSTLPATAFDAFRRACADTWGRAPVEVGSGGPCRGGRPGRGLSPDGAAADRRRDPESNAHSENESVHLGELRNCCVNEATLFSHLAARGIAGPKPLHRCAPILGQRVAGPGTRWT